MSRSEPAPKRERARPRRGHGEGSIHQRASDGRWVATVDLGRVLGKRQRKHLYGQTRQEVLGKLQRFQGALRRNSRPQRATPITLRTYLDRWLRDTLPQKVAPRTQIQYRCALTRHILPELGDLRLVDLGPEHLQAYQRRKLAEGLSPVTVGNHRVALSSALADAVAWGLLAQNVVALVRRPRVARQRISPLSAEQARVALEAVHGLEAESLLATALYLGLRRAEILGVRWDDLNLERGLVRVWDTVAHVGRAVVAQQTKTPASSRLLSLPGGLVPYLEAQRQRQAALRQAAGARWQETGYVWTTARGTPLSPEYASRLLQRARRQRPLPYVTLRQARHGHASLLFEAGADLKHISEALGHRSIRTTADIYTHLLLASSSELAALIDRALTGPPEPGAPS